MSRSGTALQDIVLLDDLARGSSWVHHLDPRAKTLATAAFLVFVASFPPHAVIELIPFFAYPLVLLLGARLPARIYHKPLGAALLLGLLIGIANPLLDRRPVVVAGGVTIAAGWLSFLSIVLRALLCVLAAVTLIATTGLDKFCHGLARMGVPRVLVAQLMFLYRYFFLLGENARSMTLARDMRSGGRRLDLPTYGSLLGHLWLRTLDRAERIHQAMLCRGYRGDLPTGHDLRFGLAEWLYLVGCCLALAALRWLLPGELLGAMISGSDP